MKLQEKKAPKQNLTIRVDPEIREKYLKMSETTRISKAVTEYLEDFIEKLAKDNLAAS